MEHSGMIEEAENLVRLGRYAEAFDRFIAIERGAYEATYLRPCQMALANQLEKPQLEELFEVLEKESVRENAHAIFNYGCIKAHLNDIGGARLLLMRAKAMGIQSASDLLNKL
jgi:hypothetical protein